MLLGNQLRFAVILTGLVLVGELIGGYLANSLALLSDAGHVFTDLVALSLSWFGVRQAAKPATPKMTYGYHRVGILIALFNATAVILICLFIFYEAYQRLQNPQPLQSSLMLGVAAAGLVANLVVVFRLRAESRQNLNVRSAFLHAFGDALSSVGVIIGAVIIYFTRWFWLDPVISILIGIIIAMAAVRLVKEAVDVLAEATPRHIDMENLRTAMVKVPGVRDIHDLHVWTIAPGMHALSSHVLVDDVYVSECSKTLAELEELLNKKFDIWHTTFQFECQACISGALYCNLGTEVSKPG